MVSNNNKAGMKRRTPIKPFNNKRFKGPPNVPTNGGHFGSFKKNPQPNVDYMFNASQIPDNPGYVDFNDPSPPIAPVPKVSGTIKPNTKAAQKPQQFRPPNNQGKPQRKPNFINGNINWKNRNNGRQIVPIPPPQFATQNRNFRNQGRTPSGPPANPMGFRNPMPPPLPPHQNFNGRPNILPMIPNMMPPRGPPMRLGRNMPIPPPPPIPMRTHGMRMRNGPPMMLPKPASKPKNKKRPTSAGGGPANKNQKSSKKTLVEILNQYPLDKPWVTDEIRTEQKKKEEIENKLKGHKDDNLFAEFKKQRDKFVTMYEAARIEYIGKHSEQDIEKIMTESDKQNGEKSV